MKSVHIVAIAVLLLSSSLQTGCGRQDSGPRIPLRVMTMNIEDIRTTDLLRPDHPRLLAAARVIQEMRPDILLVNEMTYDMEGVPGFSAEAGPGSNGRRFVEGFLVRSQGPGLEPIDYEVYAPPTNTGIASGFDLDNNGEIVDVFPPPEESGPDGAPPPQTQEQREYGNDAWGFGTYPGQYAMALFVSPALTIIRDSIRTFQRFRWRDMPGALQPMYPDSSDSWYDYLEWTEVRLSSKNHVDVPVRLSGGRILHVLASHPTPPAFDGPEMRNKLRNHDEIRFWADYVAGKDYFADDEGEQGGLRGGPPFVIVGDLNADPDEGNAYDDPAVMVLESEHVNGSFMPLADSAGVASYPDLDADDTADWGLRVDYVLPSSGVEVVGGGVYRTWSAGEPASDHFPVWLDLLIDP